MKITRWTWPHDRLPVWEDILPLNARQASASSAGSGSGRCGAIDSEVPVATREIQRRNDQEEGYPSVDPVREAHEARGGLDTGTGNMCDPEAAEAAVHHGQGRRRTGPPGQIGRLSARTRPAHDQTGSISMKTPA